MNLQENSQKLTVCKRQQVYTIHMTKIMPLVGNTSSKNGQVDGLIKL